VQATLHVSGGQWSQVRPVATVPAWFVSLGWVVVPQAVSSATILYLCMCHCKGCDVTNCTACYQCSHVLHLRVLAQALCWQGGTQVGAYGGTLGRRVGGPGVLRLRSGVMPSQLFGGCQLGRCASTAAHVSAASIVALPTSDVLHGLDMKIF
jgi:hypothetical protein